MKAKKTYVLISVLAVILIGAWVVMAQSGQGFGNQGRGMGLTAQGECPMGFEGRQGRGMGRGMGLAAQGECPMGFEGRQGRRMGRGMGMGLGMERGMGLRGLDLSDTQKSQIIAIAQKYQASMRALVGAMAAERQKAAELMFADNFDETALRQAHNAVSAIKEEMSVTKAKQWYEIRQVLTPEQLEQLKQQRAERLENRQNRRNMRRFSSERWLDTDIDL